MSLSPDWFEENSWRLKIFVFVAVLVFGLLVIVISLLRYAKDVKPRPSLSNSKSPSNSKETLTPFDAGITIGGQNWEYTINDYRCQRVLENHFNQVEAESGKKFLIVDLTFKNKSGDAIDVAPQLFDFEVHISQETFEECTDREILKIAEDYYGNIGDIYPGKSEVGSIIFEIPDRTSEVNLVIGCDNLVSKLALE